MLLETPLAPIRILLVDDDEEDYLITRELLAQAASPFSLDWEGSYEGALSKMARAEHDAYLLDYNLGAYTGLELLEAATKKGCSAPIILLTGQDDRDIDLAAMNAGAAAFLDKASLHPVLLERAVRYAVERNRALNTLRLFRSAVDHSGEAIVIATPVGGVESRIDYVNPAFCRHFGYSPAEVLGRMTTSLVKKPFPDDFLRMHETIRRREAFRGEFYNLTKSGGELPFEWTITPMTDEDGRITHVVCVGRNLTEQKQYESTMLQADRLASVGTLAAGMAHEINNPLAYIITNVRYALSEVEELAAQLPAERAAEIQAALKEACDGAERVRTIIRDLKMFSRADDAPSSTVNVQQVLEKAIAMTMNEIRHRGRLVRELGPVPNVFANEGRLGQVFVNLLINAAHALPEERLGDNVIRVVTRTDRDGRAVIEIHDNGVGISRENQVKLFRPFFTTKPVGKGTGLGLAICKGIVTAIGGDIQVESTPGRGSIFRVVLPAARDVPFVDPTPSRVPAAKPNQRPRLLVIDDEPMITNALSRSLAHSFVVETAGGARDALRRLDDGATYDVILCDVMMPGMSSAEFYAELGRRYPSLRERIVFATAGAFTEQAKTFLGSVPNPCLTKPFDLGELESRLRKRLR